MASRQPDFGKRRSGALGAAGIPAAVDTDGVVRGVLSIEPRRFKALPGAPIAPRQAFEVRTPKTIRFADPSPLSQLGDLPLVEATSLTRLTERLVRAWAQRVQLIEAAVLTARALAPNAQLYGDPWRIEGEVPFREHMVRMMFSTRGDRACVVAIDGRPVDRSPVRRKILPLDSEMTDELWSILLSDAVAQAKPCLGPPVVMRDERQLSIDLASRDLEIRPTEELPARGSSSAMTVVSPPPRLPPPRKSERPAVSRSPKPHSSDAVPTVIAPPPQLPRPHLASNPRSLVIDESDVVATVDLTTVD